MDYKHFACPDCRYYPLSYQIDHFNCDSCNRSFPIKNDVPFLYPANSPSVTIQGREYRLEHVKPIYDKAYYHDGLMGTDLDGAYDRCTKKILLDFARPLDQKYMLDLGAGVGNLWDYVDENVKGYALDPSSVGIEKVHQRHPDITISASVGENLPYSNDFFDVVIAADTIEHTFLPERTLKEIRRVLKPGAILSASFPIPHSLRKWGWNQLIKHNFNPRFAYQTVHVILKRIRLFGRADFQPIDRDLQAPEWTQMLTNSSFDVKQVIEWPQAPETPIVYLIHAVKR